MVDDWGQSRYPGWKRRAEDGVGRFDPKEINGILSLYSRPCARSHPLKLIRFSRIFSHFFHVLKIGPIVIGFSSHYVRPELSDAGIA